MPKNARIATVLALTIATLLGGAATAQAAAPPPTSSPLTCLERWDDEDPRFDYVGEGWVAAKVAEVNDVFLGCGDELSGVVHISGSDAAGSGHLITPRSQQDFLDCFAALARFGTKEPDPLFPDSRDKYEMSFPESTPFGDLPLAATMYVDRENRFVYTMFTTKTKATPGSNNWAGCAGTAATA
jgi:hypothetical protein